LVAEKKQDSMDRAMQQAYLDDAEQHIAVGSSHIEQQEQIVADIDSAGRDSAGARELLAALRHLQDQYIAHRDRIIKSQ
jgi:hypothetical protein